jgi:hypothetical protein
MLGSDSCKSKTELEAFDVKSRVIPVISKLKKGFKFASLKDFAISTILLKKFARWFRWVSYAYPAIILFALLFMYICGDRWWPASMLLFGPRWLLSFPLFLLIPMAAFCDRRLLIPLAISTLIIFGPVMRFNLPLGKITGAKHSGTQKLRVFTCNIDSAKFDTILYMLPVTVIFVFF